MTINLEMRFLPYVLAGKLFALIVGGYYFRYLSRPYKLVLALIALAFFFESYGAYIISHLHHANVWLFNCYMLIDSWFMGSAAIYLVTERKIKKVFIVLLAVYSVVWFVDIGVNSLYKYANMTMVFGLIILTVIYLIVLFSNSVFTSKSMLKQPVFWVSVSTILYCACDIPYMGLYNYLLLHSPSLSLKLFYINLVLDVIRYPLAAVSFILLGRQKQLVLNTV